MLGCRPPTPGPHGTKVHPAWQVHLVHPRKQVGLLRLGLILSRVSGHGCSLPNPLHRATQPVHNGKSAWSCPGVDIALQNDCNNLQPHQRHEETT
jgi:hypothetical protein